MRAALILSLILLNLTGAYAETPADTSSSSAPSTLNAPATQTTPTTSAAPADQVEALINISGLRQQLDHIPNAIGNTSQQAGMALMFVQPLISALQETFKPEDLVTTLRQDLMQRLDPATLADAMRWYNSDAAKNILAAEQRLAQPEVMDNIGRAISQQQWPGLTPERRKRLEELDQSTAATDTALDLMLTMQAAFLSGFSQLITPDQQNSFDSVRESFSANRDEYRGAIREQLILQQAVLLEPVPDATLQEFNGFATSPSGQKLFAALRLSLDHTLRTAALKIPAAVQQVSNALNAEVKVLPGDAPASTAPATEVVPATP